MAATEDRAGDDVLESPAVSIAFGSLCAAVAAFLTFGLIDVIRKGSPADFTPLDTAHSALLVVAAWAFAGQYYLMRARRPRLRRIRAGCGWTACIAFTVFLAGLWLKSAFASTGEPGEFAAWGHATLLVLPVMFPLLGVLMVWQDRKRRPPTDRTISSDAAFALLWPVMMFGKGPMLALAVLLVLAGTVFIGERAGALFNHALLGAFCGPVVLVAVLIGVARLPSRRHVADAE